MEQTIEPIGNCANEILIEEIFGSVSEFARQVEENGDDFLFGKYVVRYDEEFDIHWFFKKIIPFKK